MLKNIRLTPLAAESLGVRSMCTLVETPDVKMVLDAGVSLCPNRFGLPPHPDEFKVIVSCRKRISAEAERSAVITLSHYHFDHHTPSYEDWLCSWTEAGETARQIYEGKLVLAKNRRKKINYSQRRRGWMFRKTAGKYAAKVVVADGETFAFGRSTRVRFSQPVFHGAENSYLGWVLMTVVECEGEKFMFAPDVQGPMDSSTLDIILEEEPQLLMIGGPPLYLSGFRVGEESVRRALANLEKIVEKIPLVVLDHHILRDLEWREKTRNVFRKAHSRGHEILTAAEFLGIPVSLLEASRKRLFNEKPPSSEFTKWMRKDDEKKKHTLPPI